MSEYDALEAMQSTIQSLTEERDTLTARLAGLQEDYEQCWSALAVSRSTVDTLTAGQEMAWAAGLYEGEGSAFVHHRSRPNMYAKARMGLRTTDEDVIRHFLEVVGSGSVAGPYSNHGGGVVAPAPPGEYKPIWQWGLNNLDEIKALRDKFWPFLGSRRREQLDTAIAGHVTRPPQTTVIHTCECGRVIRGNAIGRHQQKCEVHNGL